MRGHRRAARLEVLPPSDPRAERALVAFMTEMSSRWLGRPASEDDVREALREFPSEGLQPPGGLLLVAHRGDAVSGAPGCASSTASSARSTASTSRPRPAARGSAAG